MCRRLLFLLTFLAGAALAAAAWCAERPSGDPPPHGHAAAPDSGGGADEAAKMNPLSWDAMKSDLAVWTAVVFVVLIFVLWRFAWGPIADGLDKREKIVSDHLADAERVNQEARDLLAGYQQKLAASQDEVRAILDQARRDAEQAGRNLVEKARQEAQREQEKAVRDIDAAAAAAMKELAEQGATLAVELAGKIVRARLRPEDHAELIRRTVAEFTPAQPGKN